MGIPVFLDMAEDDQILPMTYPVETFNNHPCQFATIPPSSYSSSSSSFNTTTVNGGRSTSPPPALPPRHPHRRLAPQVQSHTLSPSSPVSNLQQYQPFYYHQQQVQQLQQRASEPEILHRQQHQQQRQQQHIHPQDLTYDRRTSITQDQPITTAAYTRPSPLYSYYSQQQQQRRPSQSSTPQSQMPQPMPQPHPQPQPSQHQQQQIQQTQSQQPQQYQQPRRPSFQEMMFANALQLRGSSYSPQSIYPSTESSPSPSDASSTPTDAESSSDESEEETIRKHYPLQDMDVDEQRRIEFERQMILYERYQRRRQMQLAQERWQQHQQANAAAYRGGQGSGPG
ncbi:hypothetical protein BGZ90_004674, partial [Linnemannia elongata]